MIMENTMIGLTINYLNGNTAVLIIKKVEIDSTINRLTKGASTYWFWPLKRRKGAR